MSPVSQPLPPTRSADAPVSHSAPALEFEAGVIAFAGKLRAFVRKRVGDPADAEDLAQDVMLKIFRSRGVLRDSRKLEAWIYQTARSTIVDYYRRRRPADPLPEDLAGTIAPKQDVAEQLRRSVRAFLATLPDIYRRPLLLAEFRGRTAAEIATQLGLSLTATKSRLARGRALLRKRLFDCCQFETDSYGRVIDMRRRSACNCDTDDATSERKTGDAAIEFSSATSSDKAEIVALLHSAGLPTGDLESRPLLSFIVARDEERIVGCAGIEILGASGLLRSVAVQPEWRRHGLGARLVDEVDALARAAKVRNVFLLTTTAPEFFKSLGFTPLDRDLAPREIRETSEFAGICPASAVLMRRPVKRRRIVNASV